MPLTKQQEIQRRYDQSEKGKARKRRHRASARHTATSRAYEQLPEVKAKHEAWEKSLEGRAARRLALLARREKDPGVRLIASARSRMNKILREESVRLGGAYDLLGCSADQFMGWLEIQFEEGMTWDNYGEWHVDHIKPLASFDKTQPDWQKKAFHYKNTQPLWAEANLKKGAKV